MENTGTTPSRQRGVSMLPLGLALVAVLIFIGWLATRPREQAVVVQEPPAGAAVAAEEPGGPPVPIDAAVLPTAAAQQHVGQYVEIANVEVLGSLGARMIWIQAGGMPYLVQLEEGTAPAGLGQRVTIRGVVREKTEAVLDEWMRTGVLESEDHRLQAEFGTTYLQARRTQPAG